MLRVGVGWEGRGWRRAFASSGAVMIMSAVVQGYGCEAARPREQSVSLPHYLREK